MSMHLIASRVPCRVLKSICNVDRKSSTSTLNDPIRLSNKTVDFAHINGRYKDLRTFG